jgi:hypothetical protein
MVVESSPFPQEVALDTFAPTTNELLGTQITTTA